LLHPQELPYHLLHLGISALIAYPPDAIVDPLGRVALFLQWGVSGNKKDAKYGKGGSAGFRGGESDVNGGRRRE